MARDFKNVRAAARNTTLAVFATAFAIAAPCAAADAPKPLRVLVYDTAYSTETVRHEQTSGFTTAGTSGSGAGQVDHRFSSDDAGPLTVDVVAATGDRGLVVDASFDGKVAKQSTVRVAIFADGRLSADPAHPLAPETVTILPLLARGFIADRAIAPGATWSVPATAPATGTTTYKILAVDGARATIDVASSLTFRGGKAFTETVQGRTVYDTEHLAPISVDVHVVTRRDVTADQTETVDGHVVATMKSDTFAQRG